MTRLSARCCLLAGKLGREAGVAGVAAAAISWLGLLVHNVANLPGQTLISPESVVAELASRALLVVYSVGSRKVAVNGLCIWAALNFLGAALTVLPLALLPFDPEQTLRHHSFHLL